MGDRAGALEDSKVCKDLDDLRAVHGTASDRNAMEAAGAKHGASGALRGCGEAEVDSKDCDAEVEGTSHRATEDIHKGKVEDHKGSEDSHHKAASKGCPSSPYPFQVIIVGLPSS